MASSSSLQISPHPNRVVILGNLELENQNSVVLVKLLHKWPVYDKHAGKTNTSLGLAFVDSEGTRIQGHIDYKHTYKHAKHLHQGHVYLISKFKVVLNLGEYRATRHNYKLNINLTSIIRPAARTDMIPDHEIMFTPPAECLAKEYNQNYLVDVAGVLCGLHAEYPFSRGNIRSSRMCIDLENRGYRFSITLFCEFVTEVKIGS